MRKLFLMVISILISSISFASGPDLVWTGGSLCVSDEDNPGYLAETFVSLGNYNNAYIFTEPMLTLKSGDIGVSVGAGARMPILSGDVLAGCNAFFDYTDDNDHKRIGAGAEIYHHNFSAHTNIYLPLSDRNGREEALAGIDLTVGIPIPRASFISVWPGLYFFNGEDEDDMKGLSLIVKVQPAKAVAINIGARNDALTAGRDESEIFARIDITIPMKNLGMDLFKFAPEKYPIDTSQYMDHRVVRQNFITYEKKSLYHLIFHH